MPVAERALRTGRSGHDDGFVQRRYRGWLVVVVGIGSFVPLLSAASRESVLVEVAGLLVFLLQRADRRRGYGCSVGWMDAVGVVATTLPGKIFLTSPIVQMVSIEGRFCSDGAAICG